MAGGGYTCYSNKTGAMYTWAMDQWVSVEGFNAFETPIPANKKKMSKQSAGGERVETVGQAVVAGKLEGGTVGKGASRGKKRKGREGRSGSDGVEGEKAKKLKGKEMKLVVAPVRVRAAKKEAAKSKRGEKKKSSE